MPEERLFLARRSSRLLQYRIEKGHRAEFTASLSSLNAIIGVVGPFTLGMLMDFQMISNRAIIFAVGSVVAVGSVLSFVVMLRINARFGNLGIGAGIRDFIDKYL